MFIILIKAIEIREFGKTGKEKDGSTSWSEVFFRLQH
jgi:hypothetical protein